MYMAGSKLWLKTNPAYNGLTNVCQPNIIHMGIYNNTAQYL